MARDTNRRQPQRQRGAGATPGKGQNAAGRTPPASPHASAGNEASPHTTNPALAATRASTNARRPGARSVAARRRRQRTIWMLGGGTILAIVVLIIAVVAINNNNQNASCQSYDGALSCGTQAPNFTLPAMPSLKNVSLSDYKGHPVLLELFATWCPHCQRMAPVLEKLDAANRSKGLVMLSMLADPRDHNAEGSSQPGRTSVADVEWFIKRFNVKHTVLYDRNIQSSVTAAYLSYKLTGFPSVYFIDKNGVIQGSLTGEFTQADVQARLHKLFNI